VNTVCCSFVRSLGEWIKTTGRFRIVRVPLYARFNLQVILLCDFFFDFRSLCHRIKLLMNEISNRKRLKCHRYCDFDPLFYSAVMMFEEVHMPLTLWRPKRINITFTSDITEMRDTTCFALQVKRPSYLPTVRDQTGIRFRNNFSYQRFGTRSNNSAGFRAKIVPNGSQMD